MTNEALARKCAEPTIAESERLIHKMEHCESMPAKLILLRNFLERAILAFNKERQGRWVSVKERLPDTVREVEFVGGWTTPIRLLGYYSAYDTAWFDDYDDRAPMRVTHWRECVPLPEPPKEEGV